MSNSVELEQARETLAEAFRILAAEPVVPRDSSGVRYVDCEAWALHLLVGGSAPGLAKTAEADQRQWGQARLALRALRQEERSCVRQRERELTSLAGDLLSGLREAGLSAGQSAAAVDHGLQQVQELIATGDLQRVRTGFMQLAARLREEIAAQREALDRQLEELRCRVQQAERAQAESETVAVQLQRSLAELREALDDAREKMQVDPLTRVYNRGAFDVALTSYVEIAHASGQSLVLVLFDLDHFKNINDSHGHQAGDQVLRRFADLLSRAFLRVDDFVARYGGEEFAVLLFVTSEAAIPKLIESVLARLREQELSELGPGWRLTCSAGYAVLGAGENHESLFRRADGALYRAKHNGRDCLVAG